MMFLYIIVLGYILYRTYKEKSVATALLIPVILIGAAFYRNIFSLLIPAARMAALGILALCILLMFWFFRKEYKQSKVDYLRARREKRERMSTDNVEDSEKIVIQDIKSKEEKVYYIHKR